MSGTSRSGVTNHWCITYQCFQGNSSKNLLFLAVPVMFGASLLKVIKYIAAGVAMTGSELVILVIGTLVAFIVSVFVIKFLMSYIKKHDFKVFGWYRIVLGIPVLQYSDKFGT
ncbi:MAG: undecaprenyl-diphosphate phosphatase [Coprococcus phoceensis]